MPPPQLQVKHSRLVLTKWNISIPLRWQHRREPDRSTRLYQSKKHSSDKNVCHNSISIRAIARGARVSQRLRLHTRARKVGLKNSARLFLLRRLQRIGDKPPLHSLQRPLLDEPGVAK